MKITITEENVRLDQYLSKTLEKSRSKVQKMIKEGLVTKDGKKLSSNYMISLNEIIDIEEGKPREENLKPADIKIEIAYEDDYLLIINKQSGLVVHPAPGHYDDTLVNALINKFQLSNIDITRPGVVHRIDKDTSGLMLIAKDDITHEKLSLMIKNKQVERIYWAIIEGVINHDTGTIDAPIGRDPNFRQKMAVTDKNSKEAITNFKVLKRYKKNTLVECRLETGRTHQIRVHFKYINHPILGDPLYGKKQKDTSFGQYLHSKSIKFIHPITNEKIEIESSLPIEFQEKIQQLEED